MEANDEENKSLKQQMRFMLQSLGWPIRMLLTKSCQLLEIYEIRKPPNTVLVRFSQKENKQANKQKDLRKSTTYWLINFFIKFEY